MRRHIVPIAYLGATLLGLPMAAIAGPSPSTEVSAPVAVQTYRPAYADVSEETAMVLVGAALIAVAAAVRRAA
jgi:hypothetical protein